MQPYAQASESRSRRKEIPEEYFELKTKIHDRLLDIIDLSYY